MDRLRVLTINVWNRSGPWDARRELLRAGIRELQPDVVGLQEIVSDGVTNQAHEIAEGLVAEGLGYHVAYGAAATWAPGVTMGNAILSRWPLRDVHTLLLPIRDLASGPDIDEERCLVSAITDSPWGPLPVHCTHLSWRFHQGYAREAQVVAIARHIEANTPGGSLPPILVGDFNAVPESHEMRFLTGLATLGYESTAGSSDGSASGRVAPRSAFFADAFAWVGGGSGATFDPRANPFAAYSREPPRRIDYVLVHGPDDVGRGEPVAARVVLDQLEGGVAPSDHFGVFAEITVSR